MGLTGSGVLAAFGFVFILGRVAVARLERRRGDDRRDGEVAVGDRAFHALRQGDVADVDRFADVETGDVDRDVVGNLVRFRSEEHTSELQSLMRISYAVFCLKK